MIDAVVIGSGPNGLSAAIVLAQAGCKVVVFEANDTIGGGARSAELTLPGFIHDICSAVHPFAIASPFWRTLPLAAHGLEWIEPPVMLAHPFDDGSAAIVERSLEATAAALGQDGGAYGGRSAGSCADWPQLERAVLGPLDDPAASHRAGAVRTRTRCARPKAWRRARSAANATRAMFAGIAAHGMLPLDRPLTAGVGLDARRDVPRRGLADSARRRAAASPTRWCGICSRSAARSSPARG